MPLDKGERNDRYGFLQASGFFADGKHKLNEFVQYGEGHGCFDLIFVVTILSMAIKALISVLNVQKLRNYSSNNFEKTPTVFIV